MYALIQKMGAERSRMGMKIVPKLTACKHKQTSVQAQCMVKFMPSYDLLVVDLLLFDSNKYALRMNNSIYNKKGIKNERSKMPQAS